MFNPLNIKTKALLYLSFLVFSLPIFSQNELTNNYNRFVDSAKIHTEITSYKAQVFLDSIPQPLEKTIQGRLAEYYEIQALLNDERCESARSFQNYILALKYADKEKNYTVGGNASLELFASLHFVKKDSLAFSHLEMAKKYYELDNNSNGLLEVEQMYAYVEFSNHNYKVCNKLILKNLEKYKNVKDDAYFHLFATYMLTSNYIELDSLKSAHFYLKEFKSLKNNPTIVPYNYNAFSAGLNLNFAEYYLKSMSIDSVSYYLQKSSKYRKSMSSDLVRKYLNLKADVYKTLGNLDKAKTYLDSIALFEADMHNKNMEASYQINNDLIQTEKALKNESNKKFWNGVLALLLFGILSFISIFFLIIYNKNKSIWLESESKLVNLSYLKSNNEKLTGKVLGLEEYVINLKEEVKIISKIHDESLQRDKIKELYKNLHVNSATLLDKGENHLELVNELNVDFFNKIQSRFPQLNDSEVIICYYLFMGFKNKEIALFLNISIRALESKRYRISKKIQINTKQVTLPDFIKSTFKDSTIN